jgi:hypothetical protein
VAREHTLPKSAHTMAITTNPENLLYYNYAPRLSH